MSLDTTSTGASTPTASASLTGSLFVLFDEGTPQASGSSAARLWDTSGDSHGLLTYEASCSDPSTYKTFAYAAGAAYGPITGLPSTYSNTKFPITASESSCSAPPSSGAC